MKNYFSKKNSRNKTSQRHAAPTMRYYSANKSSTPAKRTERIDTTEKKKPKVRVERFLKQLPQKIVFIAIAGLLIVNTTLGSTVVKVSDENNIYRTAEEYVEGVQNVFQSSWINRSKLGIRSGEIEQQIREKFPEVTEAVAIVPLAGRDLQVHLSFVEPMMQTRVGESSISVVGIDGTYISLSESVLERKELAELPLLTILNITNIEQGTQILTSTEASLLRLLRSEFDGSLKDRPAISSVLFDIEKREMQVRFEGQSFFARISPERGSQEQVGSLLATIEQLSEDGDLPKQYIDVRVEGRVFVR